MRNQVRRGASVVAAAALLGGGLVLGGGTASAEEATGSTNGLAGGSVTFNEIGEGLRDVVRSLLGIEDDGCFTQGMNYLC